MMMERRQEQQLRMQHREELERKEDELKREREYARREPSHILRNISLDPERDLGHMRCQRAAIEDGGRTLSTGGGAEASHARKTKRSPR